MQNIIQGMSFAEYRELPQMNASTLVNGYRRGDGTMRSLKRAIDGKREEPTKALVFGNQYHSLILEPADFAAAYVVMPNYAAMPENVDAKGKPSMSWATTFCKGEKERFCAEAEANQKEVIARADYDRGIEMRRAIAENTRAMELLRACDKEVTLFGEIDSVPFKCRLDLLGSSVIADLKGARSVDRIKFGYDAREHGYLFKLAIYREVARQNTGWILPVEIIAVEKDGDFDVVVYEVPPHKLDAALEDVSQTLAEMKACQASGVWPGVDGGAKTLPLFCPERKTVEELEPETDWSALYE